MYCKNCDRDDVGGFHRCFVYGLATPRDNRPAASARKIHTNTRIARKIASLYEPNTGVIFPGGIENAAIERTPTMGFDEAWKWHLIAIDGSHVIPSFGSCYPASKIVKKDSIISIYSVDGFSYEIILEEKRTRDMSSIEIALYND